MKVPERFLSLLMGLDKHFDFAKYNYTAFCAATVSIINKFYDDKKK